MSIRLVDSGKPFQSVYSIYNHEYLGVIVSAHVVQELENGRLSLLHQGLYPENFKQFSHQLDATDKKLAALLDEISPKKIFKRFAPKSRKPKTEIEFFTQKFEGELKGLVVDFINRRLAEAMPLLKERRVGTMGNDGYPIYREVNVLREEATVLFHFHKEAEGTRYYPTIKLRGERIDFINKGAVLVSMDPAWLLLNDELFTFQKPLDGKKLKPFLNKWCIQIPPKSEEVYYRKFVTSLLEQYDVHARGFEVRKVRAVPDFALEVNGNGSGSMGLRLNVDYQGFSFPMKEPGNVKVVMEKTGENYTFYQILRDYAQETEVNEYLKDLHRDKTGDEKEGLLGWEYMEKQEALSWLSENVTRLAERNIKVEQKFEEGRINFHQPRLELETSETGDWFDIKAMVKIGNFSIPFVKFRNHILNNQRDYRLPDGSIAILPDSWFSEYRHLLEVAEEKDEETLSVRKYQAGLMTLNTGAPNGIREKVASLAEVEQVGESPLPNMLQAKLRDYQRKGYDWLHFLNRYRFGGILADDMGLGKTLQALALLQYEKENGIFIGPSLVVMPTSLIYNWLQEAAKFTPALSVLVHGGINRSKDCAKFQGYDLILTTYGIARQDIRFMKDFPFHYVILDESQMIKNPASKTNKAVRKLTSRYRLSLTGTPLENTLMDLWAQMNFLNPGLLGTETFFRDFYVIPIEKNGDEERRDQLRKLIHPFILRRTKEQVASELPPKVEKIHFCEMEEEQEKVYEDVKNSYRNYLLDLINSKAFTKNKFNIMAGLQKLRQLAIDPRLVPEGQGENIPSAKYEEFRRMLDDVLSKGSKVLVFSQFVKFLTLIREDLDKEKIPYCYLDGGTKDRMAEVDRFQTDPEIPVFLISLKAGGVGLNLTAAEYVFILDPWWNPAVENQAVDRSHRIGQKNTVFFYKFITRNSIEEKILQLQQRKARLSNEIVGVEQEVFKKLGEDDLLQLLD